MTRRERCSPGQYLKKTLNNSCYTSNDIYSLRDTYNRIHTRRITKHNPAQIWKELLGHLQCHKESCIASRLHQSTPQFAPKSPASWLSNPNEWLTSDDISAVLYQYEDAYPSFKYIGPSPSDFYYMENGTCVWEELCRFKVTDYPHKKIGIVFNLDTHNGGGTHWVSIFMDMDKKIMYYFNSTGDSIVNDPHIHTFIKKVQTQDPSFQFKENKVAHQFGNSECGMYSLYFIVTMLKTGNFSHFTRNRITDKKMEALRKIIFN